MNASKITVPANVATAIAHFVNLADTKTEALQDILSMGYETAQSEIILRHFDGNYDELMEALVCGYQIEKSPEDNVRDYYCRLIELTEIAHRDANQDKESEFLSEQNGVIMTLNLLGIKIEGVNA